MGMAPNLYGSPFLQLKAILFPISALYDLLQNKTMAAPNQVEPLPVSPSTSANGNDDSTKQTFKWVVVIWNRRDGIEIEQYESLPLNKTGLVIKKEEENEDAIMTTKDTTTKKNILWEGKVRKLCDKLVLILNTVEL